MTLIACAYCHRETESSHRYCRYCSHEAVAPPAASLVAPSVAWYANPARTAHLAVYPTAQEATAEAERAATFGWAILSVATNEGHLNLGRTLIGAGLTAGVSLFFGGSRTKGSVTVTYRRAT